MTSQFWLSFILGRAERNVGIPKENIEPSVPISKAIALEEENLAREEGVFPTVQVEVLVLEENGVPEAESMAPEIKSLAPEAESMAPEAVIEA